MEKLRNLISEGKTKKALKEILEYSKGNRSDLIDDILIISAGYNELQRKNSIGLLSSTDYQIEVNKINSSLLKYINSIEKGEKLSIPAKKNKYYLAGIIMTGFVSVALFYFLFSPSNKKLVDFIDNDRKEVLNEFDEFSDKLDTISQRDSTLGALINANGIIDRIESYKSDYDDLQKENLEALSDNDLLKSREIKRKIYALPDKHDLTPDNSTDNYMWEINSEKIEFDDSLKLDQFNEFIEKEIYTITLMANNSCGTDTASREILVLPSPIIQMQDSINEK